jgi:hypothetical protein
VSKIYVRVSVYEITMENSEVKEKLQNPNYRCEDIIIDLKYVYVLELSG